MFKLTDLFQAVVDNNASDLHLRVNHLPKLRINGELLDINVQDPQDHILTAEDTKELIAGVISEEDQNTVTQKGQVDYAFDVPAISRFRANVFREKNGLGAVFRAIPSRIQTLEDLDLPPIVKKLASLRKGLVLVTGATGSGKSTTLAAIVNYINAKSKKHILTIEDPIEFVHEPLQSVITHREVGTDVPDFPSGIKGAMREDPNVILIGEMRDLESIKTAITAAETGHLVLATLHSNSAIEAISRIVDVFPKEEQQLARTTLSLSLAGIVSQRLIPRIDRVGRVAAFEIMTGTSAVRNNIRDNKMQLAYSSMQTGAKQGMITMEQSIQNLVNKGIIVNPADEIDFDTIVTLDQNPRLQ